MNRSFCKKSMFLIIFLGFVFFIFPSENYLLGEKLFKENNPEEAIPYLRLALTEPNVNSNVYNYLGLCYYQIGKNQESLDTFLKGTTVSGTNKRQLFYNAGNSAFSLGQFNRAVEFYSYSLAADSTFANAVLNRANAYFNLVQYKDAISDYRHYLEIEPNTDQREMILRLIALLEEELVLQEEEKHRLAAEQEKIKEEEARIAAEMAKYEEIRRQEEAARRAEEERIAAENAALEAERKAQEEERRRKLLEEVASALKENESTNVSAGSEGVITYEYEEELD